MNVAQTLPKRYQNPCNLHINQSSLGGCFRPLTPETGVRFPLGLPNRYPIQSNTTHKPSIYNALTLIWCPIEGNMVLYNPVIYWGNFRGYSSVHGLGYPPNLR